MKHAFVFAFLAVTACTTTSEPELSSAAVAPAAVDSSINANLSCAELSERRLWAASILYPEETARTVSKEKAAVLDFDRSQLTLTDQDVASVKGYLLSVDTVMLQKNCTAG